MDELECDDWADLGSAEEKVESLVRLGLDVGQLKDERSNGLLDRRNGEG